jgi:predicted deacylase
VQNPVWIERIAGVTSETAGVFYPTVQRAWYVQQGMKIGYVTDLFGKMVWEARAPSSGAKSRNALVSGSDLNQKLT